MESFASSPGVDEYEYVIGSDSKNHVDGNYVETSDVGDLANTFRKNYSYRETKQNDRSSDGGQEFGLEMYNEVTEHKSNGDEGKEKILNNQCQEELQRENHTRKVNLASKFFFISKSCLDQLLDFPGIFFSEFVLFILVVSFIIIAFAVDLKRTAHHED